MTRKIARRSRRAPGDSKREHKTAVRFSAGEWAQVEAAAEREGLVTAAFIGVAALAMADPQEAAGHASRAELDALTEATEQLRRIGYLLNQIVMTMHALKQVRPIVERIAVLVWKRVEVLDDAALAVAGPLRMNRLNRLRRQRR
jgi:hypothetical protein